MLQIPEFVLEFLQRVDVIGTVRVIDLCPSSEPGAHQMPRIVEGNRRRESRNVLGLLGSGSDYGQITSKNVDDLRQLVEM